MAAPVSSARFRVDPVDPAFVRDTIGRVMHVDTLVQSRRRRFAAIVRPSGTSDASPARVLVGDSESVRTLHTGSATALAWSNDGHRLAYATGGARASEVRLWSETMVEPIVIPAVMPGIVEQLLWRGDELVAPVGADTAVGAGAARYSDADVVQDRRPGDGARTLLVVGRDLRTTTPVRTDLDTI